MRLVLLDTGPLVAVLHAGDPDHQRCVEFLTGEKGRLMTTWPVITEAMYLLNRSWKAQAEVLRLCESGRLSVADIPDLLPRIRELMEKYEDLPMDFADATLVAVAERERLDTVFTLDGDFRVYRLEDRHAIRMVP